MGIPRWLEGKRVSCPSCEDVTIFSEATARPSEGRRDFQYRCRKCDRLIRLTQKATPKKPVTGSPDFSETLSPFFQDMFELFKPKNAKK